MLGDDTRQVDATYKAVMNDEPLRSVLARSLNRKNLDLVDQFLKDNGCQRLHRHKLSNCSDKTARRVLCGVKAFNLVFKIVQLVIEYFPKLSMTFVESVLCLFSVFLKIKLWHNTVLKQRKKGVKI